MKIDPSSFDVGNSILVWKPSRLHLIIWPASTFVGVAYTDNAGKVKLSSSGVHGLTTTPAMGASVYITWSGGTGVNGLYKILLVDDTTSFTVDCTYQSGLGTPVVTPANTSINVTSITMPKLTDSSKIRCGARTSFTASAAVKSVFWSFGGVADAISSSTSTATHNTLRSENGYIEIIGKNGPVWDFIGSYITSPSGGATANYRTGSLATLSGQTISLLLKMSAANEVFALQSYLIELVV